VRRVAPMPKNINSLLQPLSHEIVTAFSYYAPCTFYIILDACDKTCTSVSECQKSYRIADCKVSITESMDRLSRAWNGCWKKLWPEAAKVLKGTPRQQDEIRNILVLACIVLGE